MPLSLDGAQKHILLLKLSHAYENIPDFEVNFQQPKSAGREWVSRVGAALGQLGLEHDVRHKSNVRNMGRYPEYSRSEMVGHISDAIEELRLELELDGESEIGMVYDGGQTYDFFRDLRTVIASATERVLFIDPYFNGEAFTSYADGIPSETGIRILGSRYAAEVLEYTRRYREQHGTDIEVRKIRGLHDRVVVIDDQECWLIGASIKDAARNAPTYMIPLSTEIAAAKIAIYSDIWEQAEAVG